MSLYIGNKRYKLYSGRRRYKFSEELPKIVYYTFHITASPSDAIITINGEQTNEIRVPESTNIEWSVSRDGYVTRSGEFTIYGDLTLDITLEEDCPYERNQVIFDSNGEIRNGEEIELETEGVYRVICTGCGGGGALYTQYGTGAGGGGGAIWVGDIYYPKGTLTTEMYDDFTAGISDISRKYTPGTTDGDEKFLRSRYPSVSHYGRSVIKWENKRTRKITTDGINCYGGGYGTASNLKGYPGDCSECVDCTYPTINDNPSFDEPFVVQEIYKTFGEDGTLTSGGVDAVYGYGSGGNPGEDGEPNYIKITFLRKNV